MGRGLTMRIGAYYRRASLCSLPPLVGQFELGRREELGSKGNPFVFAADFRPPIVIFTLMAIQVGDKKRGEKICERTGLTFHAPDRPRKSVIVHAHSDESGAANNRSPKGTI